MRVRVGDVIEPAALRRNVQYKVLRGINDHTTIIYEPKVLYRSEQNNCQMNELMFQAGVKGMSERSELIPCIIIIISLVLSPLPTFQ